MIKLTKTDGQIIAINENFIEHITQTPDTFITLASGKTLVVKESIDDIYDMIKNYVKECHTVIIDKSTKMNKVRN